MPKKLGTPNVPVSATKIGRDASSGQFIARAEKWATANSATREAAIEKLRQMGIYDSTGKLAKDYR